MPNEILVISDIHLENKTIDASNFLLDSINETLHSYKTTGVSPTIVCAGDLHNGINGLPWLSKIQTEIVYVCGNHEFWNQDYYETIELMKQNSPSNVHILHNDFVIINDNIFIGGTLWSDLGEQLNPDIIYQAKHYMNDINYITHKSWYDSNENISLLKSFDESMAEDMIINKKWNVLIEREENKKTITFYNNFIEVYNNLIKIPEILEQLETSVNSKYHFLKITPEIFHNKTTEINSYLDNITYESWIHKNSKLLNIQNEQNSNYEEKNVIFHKLKRYNLQKLKIIMVSHHLPFLEERLIGHQERFEKQINTQFFNNIPTNIYNIRNGLDYPIPNYLWRLAKGEIDNENNIFHIVHYCNDGSKNIPKKLLEHVHTWVHGHEHHYNYEGILKGIKIATNPLADKLSTLQFNNSKASILDFYKKFNHITNDSEFINIFKSDLLRKVDITMSKEDILDTVDIWALKNFSWDKYISLSNYIETLNKKLFINLLHNPQWTDTIPDSEKININILMDAIDLSIERLENIELRLSEGITIRKNIDYSFSNKNGGLLEHLHLSKYIKFVEEPLHKFNVNQFDPYSQWTYDSWIRIAFTNLEYIKLNNNIIKKTQNFFNKIQIINNNDVNGELLDKFNNSFSNNQMVMAFELQDKLSEKLAYLKSNYFNKQPLIKKVDKKNI